MRSPYCSKLEYFQEQIRKQNLKHAQDELEALGSDQCRAELAVRRAASFEESLEEARDTISKLKGLMTAQSEELGCLRDGILRFEEMESQKLCETNPSTALSSHNEPQQQLKHDSHAT